MVRYIFMRRDYTYIVMDRHGRFVSSHRTEKGAKRVVRKCNTVADLELEGNRPYQYRKERAYL